MYHLPEGDTVRKSSTTLQGLFVLPGVIDADYEGEIRIMAWTPGPPCSVTKGSKIAQLVYLTAAPPNSVPRSWGDSGFGSEGTPQIFWAQTVTQG